MGLGTAMLNSQHYKVWIKGKGSNQGKGGTPPQHLDVVAIEKDIYIINTLFLTKILSFL